MDKRVTVFVPTYNREKYLPRLLNSLKIQDSKDFKLLVIDDGSTDNTYELIESWKKKNYFSIRYIKKQNGGFHTAFNKAIEVLETELVLVLGSDDYLKPHVISTVLKSWDSIEKKEEFAGIQYLCCFENGDIIGSHFTKKYLISLR